MTKSYRIDPEHNTTRHVIQLSQICKGMEHVKNFPPKAVAIISSLADYRSTDSLPPPAECTLCADLLDTRTYVPRFQGG